MKGAGVAFLIIIALFLLFGPFQAPIVNGITGWRTNDTTEPFLVVTGGGETSQNVTLSFDLYQAALAEIDSITSDLGTDTPVSTLYTSASKILTVGGLTAGSTRNLSIHYLAETSDTTMRIVGPFLAFLIFGGAIFVIFKVSTSSRGRR